MSTQKKNNMLVSEVMMSLDLIAVIGETVIMKEALEEMGRSHLGIACIVDDKKKLLGILTDGDIRRKVLKIQKPFAALLVDDALVHAIRSPTIVQPDMKLKDAIFMMNHKKIWDLPVVNSQGILVGLLHLHPAIQALLRS
jgi:CBS domain-containing protein